MLHKALIDIPLPSAGDISTTEHRLYYFDEEQNMCVWSLLQRNDESRTIRLFVKSDNDRLGLCDMVDLNLPAKVVGHDSAGAIFLKTASGFLKCDLDKKRIRVRSMGSSRKISSYESHTGRMADQKFAGFSQTDSVECNNLVLTRFKSHHPDYHNRLMYPESMLVVSRREEQSQRQGSISEWIAIGNSQFDVDLKLIPRLSTEIFDIPIYDFMMIGSLESYNEIAVIGWSESQMQRVVLREDNRSPNKILSEPGGVTILDNVILEDVSAPFVDTYERLPVWTSINDRESVYFWVNNNG